MTNRKFYMGFPTSHQPRFYAAPNFLKMGIKYLNLSSCDRQTDTQRNRQIHTHRSRAIVFTALAWHRAVKLTINTVVTSSVLSDMHYSYHTTSHGEGGCWPQWPLAYIREITVYHTTSSICMCYSKIYNVDKSWINNWGCIYRQS